jgi:hypothetical protein
MLVHTPLDVAERLSLQGSSAVASGVARVLAERFPS